MLIDTDVEALAWVGSYNIPSGAKVKLYDTGLLQSLNVVVLCERCFFVPYSGNLPPVPSCELAFFCKIFFSNLTRLETRLMELPPKFVLECYLLGDPKACGSDTQSLKADESLLVEHGFTELHIVYAMGVMG